MHRRSFLGALTALPLAPLPSQPCTAKDADLADDRTLIEPSIFGPPYARVATPQGRARVAIVFCPGFRPRSWRDIPEGGVLLNAGLTGHRLVRAAAIHPTRTLGIVRYLRHLRISPAALCDLLAHCEQAELPVVPGNLIRSRRWDQKARRLAAWRQKGGQP